MYGSDTGGSEAQGKRSDTGSGAGGGQAAPGDAYGKDSASSLIGYVGWDAPNGVVYAEFHWRCGLHQTSIAGSFEVLRRPFEGATREISVECWQHFADALRKDIQDVDVGELYREADIGRLGG